MFGVVTGGFCLWNVANVMLNFSIYYDVEGSVFVNIVYGLQYVLFFIGLSTSILWTRLWLQRQKGERWELTLEEFSFLFFAVITFFYSVNGSIWAYANDNTNYKDRTEADFIFLVGSNLLFATLLVGNLDYIHGFESLFYSSPFFPIQSFPVESCALWRFRK